MLPLLVLAAWPTDATARAALQQSMLASVTDVGMSALTTGADLRADLSTTGPTSSYGASAGGRYARLMTLGNSSLPTDNFSFDTRANGQWQTSPNSSLSADLSGYLASRYGVRASDMLAVRDPFLFGNRLQYTMGGGLRFTQTLSARASLTASGGYAQVGALDAEFAEAIGVDTHAGRGGMSLRYELGPRDAMTNELLHSYTHFYHALYDAELTRGPADIHATTGLFGLSHVFGRRVTGALGGGLTVATPPPIMKDDIVVAPEARASLKLEGERYTVDAGYQYAYASLGPRVGYGTQQSGTFSLSLRPLKGRRWHDFGLLFSSALSYGRAPIAAQVAGQADTAPSEGTVTTTTVTTGLSIEIPLVRGVSMTGGFDLQFIRGVIDPEPRTGQLTQRLQTITMLGVAGTLSTDRARVEPAESQESARAER